ncbi:unnamed protein product [Gemmata massiliana]|uniref:Uncharacterized protein n=1 Tax=Gemmata massiliana TaxID=1210884 RepID=A0A6P2CSZ3_9BACT|nr:hypothetical protein [Gemmata massiliana]VTR92023.1 unnamed protein product [Gemmata massiliana]
MADPIKRPVVGTIGPIYASHNPDARDPEPVIRDEEYFLVRVHSAQASYKGTWWTRLRSRVRHVVVTSQVTLKRNQPAEAFQHIQVVRPIRPREAVQLGLRPNLIDLVPAVVERVSVKFGLVLDQEDRLEKLTAGINGSGFLSTLSLAEPTLAAARAVAGVSKVVLDAFLPGEAQKGILEFSGDFNIGTGIKDLRPGYYVFLGTTDKGTPLPHEPKVEVEGASLLVDDKPVTDWSYFVLEVLTTRERGTNPDAEWSKLINKAEAEATNFANSPVTTKQKQEASQQRCQELLVRAQGLFETDPTYTKTERKAIIANAFKTCKDTIAGTGGRRSSAPEITKPWVETTLAALGVGEDDLAAVDDYKKRVETAKQLKTLIEQKDQQAQELWEMAEAQSRLPLRDEPEADADADPD